MKKNILLLVFTTVVSVPALSQGWRIAPTVGVNISAISYSSTMRNALNADMLNTAPGPLARFQAGALLDYAFSDRFSIRSGLMYTGKGGSLRIDGSQYGISETIRGSYQLNYMEIPLLLNIAIGDNGFRLTGGPVLGVTLNGKGVVDSRTISGYGYYGGSNTTFDIGSRRTDDILPLDLSVSLGLVKEIEVGDRPLEIGLYVQPSYSKWTTRSTYDSDFFARNLLAGLRVAYLFELRR